MKDVYKEREDEEEDLGGQLMILRKEKYWICNRKH
jgi:hypothetical protein